MTDPNPLLTAALALYTAGMSPIPVRADGTKAPATAWKQYQTTRATPQEILAWFGPGSPYGLGVVTGPVSANLLMIEVEGRAANQVTELRNLAYATGQQALWDKFFNGWAEHSPSGGAHWFVRTEAPTPPNQKLARTAAGEVLAETRGAGGYVVTAPSAGTVHATGKPWVRALGAPAKVPTLTPGELEDLFALFSTLGEAPPEFHQPHRAPTEAADGVLRPGDDYEARTDWADILEPAGWALVHTAGRTRYWCRPGKNEGVSATTGRAEDRDRFYVFSSSTPFEQENPYTKFAAFAVLAHGGDHKAAAADLRKQGFGDPAPAPAATPPPAPAPARPPAAPITLDQAHAVYRKWLGADYDTDALDAVLAAAAGDHLTGDPLWLLLISGSGNAKTETVQALDGIGATITSTITSTGALLSATSTKEKTADATGGLLRKMGATGVLVVKDFTSIISMDRNARGEVLSAVREVYDGRWERNVGTDGGRSLEWRGRLVVIGAVTTAWDRAHDVIASMGDRFVLIRMDSSENRQAAGRKAIGNTGHEEEMRTELAAAAAGVLANIGTTETITLTAEETETIMEAANIVTLVRTGVDYDYRGDVIDSHAPEMPTRFAKQLAQVVRGAVAVGMDREQAMRLAVRCARDSMPPIRLDILDDVAAHPDTATKDVTRRLQKPRSTVDRQLQALHILGLLTVEEEPILYGNTEKIRWRYTVHPDIDPDAIKTAPVPDLLVPPRGPEKTFPDLLVPPHLNEKRGENRETVRPPSNKSGKKMTSHPAPPLGTDATEVCPLHPIPKPRDCFTCGKLAPPPIHATTTEGTPS